MEQSPSRQANRFSASKEILRTLWNPQAQYRVYKCPPPVAILSQIDKIRKTTLLITGCILTFVSSYDAGNTAYFNTILGLLFGVTELFRL